MQVGLLNHADKWHRQTALRLLDDRKDAAAIPALREMVATKTDQTALEALWQNQVRQPRLKIRRRQCQRIDVMGTDPQLLIQDVRSQLSDAQRLDECSERGWMLAPARVVQEEARERRTPVFEYPHQRPACEMWRRLLI